MPQSQFANGRYTTQAVIGSGGMALVLRVFDQYLKVERAKLLPRTLLHKSEARTRHEQEAHLAAQLNPHVVPVHDFLRMETSSAP